MLLFRMILMFQIHVNDNYPSKRPNSLKDVIILNQERINQVNSLVTTNFNTMARIINCLDIDSFIKVNNQADQEGISLGFKGGIDQGFEEVVG